MSRFRTRQPDLFAPPPEPEPPPGPEPVAELGDLLARLRAAELPPWRTVTAAIELELRTMWLGRSGGPECADLATAVLAEVERLFLAEEGAQPDTGSRRGETVAAAADGRVHPGSSPGTAMTNA